MKMILQHSPESKVTVIDNLLSAERENLPETLAKQEMYVGGPVEPGRGFVIHTPEFNSESTLSISENVRLTATLEVLRAIATGRGPQKIIMALGYSGWSAGQLDSEMDAGGWLTIPADIDHVFDPPERLWRKTCERVGREIMLPTTGRFPKGMDASMN